MKIVTKLKIFGIYATLLIFVLGWVTQWRSHQIDLAIERDRFAREIVREAFALNVLSVDYIRTQGERAEIQWEAQYRQLHKSISGYKAEDAKEQNVLDDLTLSQKAILDHFNLLKKNIKSLSALAPSTGKDTGKKQDPTMAKVMEDRLNNQLSVDTQNIVFLASTLADVNSLRLERIRQTSYAFLEIVLVFFGLSLVLSYALLATNISKSITTLIKGTKIIADGNLGFRYKIKSKDEFGELAVAFNNMAEGLEKLDDIKTEFIYLVSHELRTPVGAIKGFVSMISEGDYGAVGKKMEKPLSLITVSINKVLTIVNNMLNVAKLQAGKVTIHLEEYDLGEMVNQAVASKKHMATEKKISMKVKKAASMSVSVDKEKALEILSNLLDNAVKFTEEGSVVISTTESGGKAVVHIADTGIGIAKEYQEKLFDKFDEIKLKQAGIKTGIGLSLYVSREFARKMGGDLWIEKSEIGKGTTFGLTFPKK